jgi:hypothetical protein
MNTEKIENRAHEALKYLTDTDELAAELKIAALRAEAKHEAVVDAVFLTSEGSIEVRKAAARSSEAAQTALNDFFEATRQADAVLNMRRSQALAVEWCRSLYSNYRQGK